MKKNLIEQWSDNTGISTERILQILESMAASGELANMKIDEEPKNVTVSTKFVKVPEQTGTRTSGEDA